MSQGHIVEDIRADQNTNIGIRIDGYRSLIRNNLVVATGGTTVVALNPDAIGIFAFFGAGARMLNNDVIDTTKLGTGTAVAIQFADLFGGLAVNNRITGSDKGIEYANATGKYRDNITVDVTTPYTGGTDIGNND